MTELSPQSRDIVERGRAAMTPLDAASERIRAAVASRTAEAARAAGAGSGVAVGGASVVKLVILAGFLGIAVTWLVVRSQRSPDVARPSPAAVASPRGEPTDEMAVPGTSPPPSSEPRVDAGAAPSATSRAITPRRRRVAPTTEATTSSRGLSVELAMLEQARREMNKPNPRGALDALDSLERQVSTPQLEREAALLRAEALCVSGDKQRASEVLDSASIRWPSAPGIATVQRICARAEK